MGRTLFSKGLLQSQLWGGIVEAFALSHPGELRGTLGPGASKKPASLALALFLSTCSWNTQRCAFKFALPATVVEFVQEGRALRNLGSNLNKNCEKSKKLYRLFVVQSAVFQLAKVSLLMAGGRCKGAWMRSIDVAQAGLAVFRLAAFAVMVRFVKASDKGFHFSSKELEVDQVGFFTHDPKIPFAEAVRNRAGVPMPRNYFASLTSTAAILLGLAVVKGQVSFIRHVLLKFFQSCSQKA